MIRLSLLEFDQLNSPEVVLGLTAIISLLAAIVVGFFYKRYQSRKTK